METILAFARWLNRRWWGKPLAWLIYAVLGIVAVAASAFLITMTVGFGAGVVDGATSSSASGSAAASRCDPSYAGACLDPNAPDYDCEGGTGDGPRYTSLVRVVGDDHYDLDRDGDRTGCD